MAKSNENKEVTSVKGYKNNFLKSFSSNICKLIVLYLEQKYSNTYLDTQNTNGDKDSMYADVIELGGSGVERVEKYIYGLKVVDSKLFIATEYIETEDNPKPIWSKEDFEKEENWSLLTEEKSIVIVPTLCCIADCIEQY